MSETYSVQFQNIQLEMRKQKLAETKAQAIKVLHEMPNQKHAAILGEALGLMEYEMNEAKKQETSLGSIASVMQEEYHDKQRHATILEMFINDVRKAHRGYLQPETLDKNIKAILEEYDEYRTKRNKDQLNK